MKPNNALIRLVDQSLARNLTRVEMAQLEELLENDDALHYYLSITSIEGNLPLALNAPSTQLAPLEPVSSNNGSRLLRMAAAAIVLFSIGLFCGRGLAPSSTSQASTPPSPDQHSSARISATITSLIGVEWDGDAPDSLKLTGDSNPIKMRSGLMELTFASGVRTLIEGPAQISVTGDNQAYLTQGRMVADVPKGAEGFTVNYSAGKVVDLGTEFALNIPSGHNGVEVGVFRGEVEVYNKNLTSPKKLIENHAILHNSNSDTPFESIPFYRKNYIRHLPSREFPWQLPNITSDESTTLEYDVSHLVWKSGRYCAIIKWMHGSHGITIQRAELLLNGEVIDTDSHKGRSGIISRTQNNLYTFDLSGQQHRRGKWTLRITVSPDIPPNEHQPVNSTGTILFEDFNSIKTTDASAIGTWEYRHNGDIHQRIFTSDHRVKYILNGKPRSNFSKATWHIQDSILTLKIPRGKSSGESVDIVEKQLLHNGNQLIFVNRPYRNAIKVK